MFSQFRQAVEQLAQQVPVPHVASPTADDHERRSLDVPSLPSGQLAENALHSLRKSLSQRSATSDTGSTSPNPNGRASPSTPPVRKSNLEERLRRVTHGVAESSSSSPSHLTQSPSPALSKKSTSLPSMQESVAPKRVMSPTSTPLPQSPALLADDLLQLELPSSSGHIEQVPKLELEKGDSNIESPPYVEVVAVAESSDEERKGKEEGKEPELPAADGGDDISAGEEKKEEQECTEATEEPHPINPESSTTPSLSSPPVQPQAVEELPSISHKLSPQEPTPDVEVLQSKDAAAVPPSTESIPGPLLDSDVSEEKEKEQAVEFEDNKPSLTQVSAPTEEAKTKAVGVEELQQRLKQVEQRFTDVSTSFKRLQAEKIAADAILRELTPIDTIRDNVGLGDYLKSLNAKQEIFQSEIKLLNGKLSNYEERLEELRDVHRLESKSQTDQIDKLRIQLQETEALFQASEKAITDAEEKLASDKADTKTLQAELERYKTVAKEEEEKRVKAVSLLKTVRQKLVRTEKEKEDVLREVAASKDRDRGEKEKEHVERLKLQQELEMLQIEKEKVAAAQKAQFDREMALMKERYEKELSAVKGGLELEIITLKSSHSKELAAKSSQITTLENSLNSVTRDKNVFFEQLQIKQAETESAQSHLESLHHQNTELEFQLREANDRLSLVREEYSDYQREQETVAREPVTSATDIAQMISATESKYEIKLTEMKRSAAVLEKERSESEANWSRKLKEKVKELEDLKKVLGTTAKSREDDINVVEQLKIDLGRTKEEVRILKEQLLDVPALQDKIQDLKKAAKDKEEEIRLKNLSLENLAEDHKSREAQLKQANKTLREELRKVQSSAALLERQRNPGVGYWNRVTESEPQSPTTSEMSNVSPRPSSPAPSSTATVKNEEEVNLEYLRNVILQFLEHKDMRPSLVKVISIILHFTPQETRRLMAKV